MITTLPCLYFNSIKVRLKHTAVESSDGTTRFQFHKGTIKTDKNSKHAVAQEISIQ